VKSNLLLKLLKLRSQNNLLTNQWSSNETLHGSAILNLEISVCLVFFFPRKISVVRELQLCSRIEFQVICVEVVSQFLVLDSFNELEHMSGLAWRVNFVHTTLSLCFGNKA